MKLLRFIFGHKKIFFLYIPLIVILIMVSYAGIIYLEWQSNREAALKKLSRYKLLIDRTEELKKGYKYTQREVDVNAKVVDLPTRIYDRSNKVIGEFFEEKREIVPFDYISEWIVNGVIASEDRDFKKHHGISYSGIFRAFVKNLMHLRVVQGGSTVTQQLAKVLFTDMERSLKRKIYEAYCALEIEELYDKQDIISMYLNLIYFGNGAYGVEATSKMFFGKSVREIGIVESCMIVATISNPRYYSPIANIDNSVKKTRRILKSLSDAGYLDAKKIDLLYNEFKRKWNVIVNQKGKVTDSDIGKFIYSSYRINKAPFFTEMIRRKLITKFGEDVVKRGGLSVYTTLDSAKQESAIRSLRKGIENQREYHVKVSKRIRNKGRSEAELEKSENIEGALISIDPRTGAILSYAGGYSFSQGNQLDNVYQIRRQPGSSIKPMVYTAAIERRKITPSTVVEDKKRVYDNKYSPENYDHKYHGPVTIRKALIKSLNTVAVYVLTQFGYDRVFSYVQKGLCLSDGELRKRFMKTPSFALGAYEISPLESVQLNSTLVNGGQIVIPYGIKHVKDYNNNKIWDNESDLNKELQEMRKVSGKILDPAAGRITISMLQGIAKSGSSTFWLCKKYKIDFDIAGKTGTTSNYNDAWFLGFTGSDVTAVWIGNKKGSISLGRGRSASGVAAPVWFDYIAGVYKNSKPATFDNNFDTLTTEVICLDSGKVAGKMNECPHTAEQYYYSGSEPGEFCHIHVKKEGEK